MMIDQTTQRFSNIGFARFTTLSLSNLLASDEPSVRGNCSLVYLGNHFYNAQAIQNPYGVAFPYELIILWIVALCVFLLLHFIIKPQINEQRTTLMNKYGFAFHILLIIIAIVLVDFEVLNRFGISGVTALFTQGFSSIAVVFLFVESLVWALGYVLFALPIRIFINSGLRILGVGKGGNGIGKGIGVLSIWIFCGLYLILILNTILALIHIDLFSPVG